MTDLEECILKYRNLLISKEILTKHSKNSDHPQKHPPFSAKPTLMTNAKDRPASGLTLFTMNDSVLMKSDPDFGSNHSTREHLNEPPRSGPVLLWQHSLDAFQSAHHSHRGENPVHI